VVEVIPAPACVVGDLVDLTDDFAQFGPGSEVVLAGDEYFPLHFLPYLNRSQTFLSVDGLGY
jgi:hypothetical protein